MAGTKNYKPVGDDIATTLYELQDEKYRIFQCRLMPGVEPETVIGVRMPALHKLARGFSVTERESFFRALPHKYYEENALHAILIGYMDDFSACVEAVDSFLPYIDNWSICDILSPKAFTGDLPALYSIIKAWTRSSRVYTVRFGIVTLLRYYMGDAFRSEQMELVAGVESDEYYINMARAWYFATVLTYRYDDALPFIADRRLDPWTHNKAIQKAIESLQIPKERKERLRALKTGARKA